MIYLASPYSHDDPNVRTQRFDDVCFMASLLMKRGFKVFSPIAHSHPIAVPWGLPDDIEFWKDFDFWFIDRCDEFWVLMIDGWDESKGIEKEIDFAEAIEKPIKYVDMEGRIFENPLDLRCMRLSKSSKKSVFTFPILIIIMRKSVDR